MLKKKKYLQIQSNTQNPYFKQRPSINKIIEETKTILNINNNKPKPQNPKTPKPLINELILKINFEIKIKY